MCQGIDSLLNTGDGDVQAVIAEQSHINLSPQQQESNVSRTFEDKVPDMLCWSFKCDGHLKLFTSFSSTEAESEIWMKEIDKLKYGIF